MFDHQAQVMVNRCQDWLKTEVFPLWSERGVDAGNGGFIEALSYQAEPLNVPRRAMVQARQIYSFVTGMQMQVLDENIAKRIITRSGRFFCHSYLLPSGACLHAVTPQGEPHVRDHELYTQAFALFALAQLYHVTPEMEIRNKALALLRYLRTERRHAAGGYTEVKSGKTLFQSNPHMHLYEAALAWVAVDPQAHEWRDLAIELHRLCEDKFIDKQTGILAEHFTHDWKPELHDGKFVFEPGHHFEWAWLMAVHEELGGPKTLSRRHHLYQIATTYGINSSTRLAVDEVWSDGTTKKSSSRFWPQTERVKAAVKLALDLPSEQRGEMVHAADEAMRGLFVFLQTQHRGLWQDTLVAPGEFTHQEPKASSLYHIINAMSEYVKIRPNL